MMMMCMMFVSVTNFELIFVSCYFFRAIKSRSVHDSRRIEEKKKKKQYCANNSVVY